MYVTYSYVFYFRVNLSDSVAMVSVHITSLFERKKAIVQIHEKQGKDSVYNSQTN